jgi:hypothetical protein
MEPRELGKVRRNVHLAYKAFSFCQLLRFGHTPILPEKVKIPGNLYKKIIMQEMEIINEICKKHFSRMR